MSGPKFRIVQRPPRAGERGWWVSADDSVRTIRRKVDRGRDSDGMPGWPAFRNYTHEDSPDEDGDIIITVLVDEPTVLEKRARNVERAAVRAKVRAAVREVLDQAEHLALDNGRDRRQLERMLVEALTK